MEIFQKARLLSDSGKFDSCGPKACEVNIDKSLGGIYHAKTEHKTCRLYKTLMSNSCSFDCKYCFNSKTKNKISFQPEELSKLFMHLVKKLDVHGLFLSSAVNLNPDRETEKMIQAVKLLRFKYRFRGYIHFKVLPGTSFDLIKQASELSNRMSINIEAPNKSVLSEMSNCKDFHSDILKRQAWISKLNKNQTTQLIVNDLTTDKDILKMIKWEYEKLKLSRIYFSAFRPVKGTKFENKKPTPLFRQNHLYNIDFLARRYKFDFKDFEKILKQDMLPNQDPKLALAMESFDSPLDINKASYEELIRVPGIGLKTAQNIIISRKKSKITNYNQLNKLGTQIKKSKPFINVNGKTQKMLSEFC